jgi:indolepyruvate ferredoxin oxidoreductase alpha subunit
MIPAYARKRHVAIQERTARLRQWVEETDLNRVEMGDRSLGIISAGVAYQYAREIFPEASFLKLGMLWPLPEKLIQDFAALVDQVIVVEELDPFIEEWVAQLGIEVKGKAIFPAVGELTPERMRTSAVEAGLLSQTEAGKSSALSGDGSGLDSLPLRPPVLCAGCGHRDAFWVLRKLKVAVNSDIGCYALGVLPPLETTDTLGAMGASIGVAMGMRLAGLKQKNVAVIGDSTFFHSGLPALAAAVYNRTPVTVVVVDNRTTGMTGHQGHPGSGRTLENDQNEPISIAGMARAMGVRHVLEVNARDLAKTEAAIRQAMDAGEPAVVVVRAICMFESQHNREPYNIIAEDCNGCTLCFHIGCPAIYKSDELDEKSGRPKAWIDPAACVGCGLCFDVCARQAIEPGAEKAGLA